MLLYMLLARKMRTNSVSSFFSRPNFVFPFVGLSLTFSCRPPSTRMPCENPLSWLYFDIVLGPSVPRPIYVPATRNSAANVLTCTPCVLLIFSHYLHRIFISAPPTCHYRSGKATIHS